MINYLIAFAFFSMLLAIFLMMIYKLNHIIDVLREMKEQEKLYWDTWQKAKEKEKI